MSMNKKLIKQVLLNEYHFLDIFCEKIVKDVYIRYFDNQLKDMWDLNFTKVNGDLSPEMIDEIKQYKTDMNESHIQVCSYSPIDGLVEMGFDHGITLTMAATSIKVNPPKINGIEFKNTTDNPEIINDVLKLELKYYGELWGYEFGARNIYHHFSKMRQRDNYYYLTCYYCGKNIGQCYAFYSDGVVVIDGLIVEEKYRHLNIGSNLILQVKNKYNCPIYLHAYEEEDAKDLYIKLGFVILYRQHDYLLLDKKNGK